MANKLNKKIVFLGAGNMGFAIASGLVSSALVNPLQIAFADTVFAKATKAAKNLKARTFKTNQEATKWADIIFIAVKPGNILELVKNLGKSIDKSKLVISVAAGISASFIEKNIGSKVPVIRSMPNTPALVGEGAIAISAGRYATKNHLLLANKLFGAVGKVFIVPEKLMNAITAVSGSGPAYVFYLCELLEEVAQKLGLSLPLARELSAQTFFGAGKMLLTSKSNVADLRLAVTSPNGTTEAAIKHLQKNIFGKVFKDSVMCACKRAQELSR
ncbi:MAG: pyrroline-5-carboxylate reductase [Endomicrobiales bacterium]|nr:pyrroline-5-carboxylate reductase [Endomicrobiales bacterium]